MKRSSLRSNALVCAAFFALTAVAYASDDVAAPPSGITPTRVTLAEVLARHRAAESHLAPNGKLAWRVAFGSMTGERTEVWSGADMRTDMLLGPYHMAEGRVAGKSWHQNENGEVVPESGIHRRDAISARALAVATPESKDVTLLGEVQSPVHAFVLRVAPPMGRVEYRFIDTNTYQLVRIEEPRDGVRLTTTYDDFKPGPDGKLFAHHLHREDGRVKNIEDEAVSSEAYTAVSADQLAEPSPGPSIVSFNGSERVTLPAKIVDDRIILMTKMGGHTVDLQLDSGASGIVLNNRIARALKFEEHGRYTSAMAADYDVSDVTIKEANVGGVTVKNAYARSVPFLWFQDEKTPIAGLMGFDFIDQCVLHISYASGTVEAIDPERFTAPSDAVAIPIALDDNVPTIAGRIAGIQDVRFLLDTGADNSLLFSSFTNGRGKALADSGLGDAMRAAFPFVSRFQGVGGYVSYRPLQVSNFSFASWTFDRWLFNVTTNAPTFEIEDYDGIVGQDVLRYYDVYLDYQRQRVLLAPNSRYKERFG